MTNRAEENLRDLGRRVEDKFNEKMPWIEEEVKKVIAYLNDEVVPEVREHSSRALRTASEQLNKLAERLDRDATSGSAKPDSANSGDTNSKTGGR